MNVLRTLRVLFKARKTLRLLSMAPALFVPASATVQAVGSAAAPFICAQR